MTFRFSPAVACRRLVIATAVGALLGVLLYLDQQALGGYADAAAIAFLPPLRGFWWHVSGGALVGVAFVAVGGLVQLLEVVGAWRRRRSRDLRHSAYCNRYYDRRASRCCCKAEAQNWTAAERRDAWRTIQGGRE